MPDVIKVDGLAQFNRSLRRLDSDAPKALRLALNDAATLLVDEVAPTIPRRTGAARRSLRAASTRTSARVSMGGNRAPWMPWLDFGGRTGRHRSVKRPFIKEGRYFFPGLNRAEKKISEQLEQSLVAVARSAGLAVD